MGQEILYCYKCQTRLLGSEFEKGKAFKVGAQASCANCVKDLLASMPEAAGEVDRKLSSSARIRAPLPETPRVKPPTVRTGPLPGPASSRTPLTIAIVVSVLVVVAIAVAMSSGRNPVNVPPSNATGPHPPAPPSVPPKPEDPKPPPPSGSFAAELREIDEKMRSGLANGEFRQVAES